MIRGAGGWRYFRCHTLVYSIASTFPQCNLKISFLDGFLLAHGDGDLPEHRQDEGADVVQPRGDVGRGGAMPGAGPTDEPETAWTFNADGNVMGMAAEGCWIRVAS